MRASIHKVALININNHSLQQSGQQLDGGADLVLLLHADVGVRMQGGPLH